MNDPHVVALTYRIDHRDTIYYSKPEPFSQDEQGFRLTVEDNRARFEFKEHYATVEKAREALADYIRVWEFHAQLEHGPHSFRLKFDKPEVMDRKPTPGEVPLSFHLRGGRATGSAKLTNVVNNYPRPPRNLALSPDVETMFQRFMNFRRRREPLPSMAYFCLSMLEDPPSRNPTGLLTKNRRAAAHKFGIDKNVLVQVGRLSSTAGESAARKREGFDQKISAKECLFLQEAVKAIIRRMAERHFAPDGDLPIWSLSDLPSLENDVESNTTK